MTDRTPSLTYTAFERSLLERIKIIEQRNIDLETMYDKACADLIEALDRVSAYRATASSLHQEIERRTGVDQRQKDDPDACFALHRWDNGGTGARIEDRRKSWPR
jgi:hypothetical protein